jgi:hypothetical protein
VSLPRPGPARTFGLLGATAALGGIVGFVTGYLDLPDDPGSLSYIVDWRSRMEVTGAQWEGLVGALAGFLAGALVRRAWLAIAGMVVGALAGLFGGGLLGMIIGRDPRGGTPGVIIGLLICLPLGFLIGLGADFKREGARREPPVTGVHGSHVGEPDVGTPDP